MLKNLKNRLNENKGFSLVELIVVIAIMVILIALLVPNVIGYITSSQKTANLSAAKSIYNAANTCIVNVKSSTGAYPASDELAYRMSGTLDGSTASDEGKLVTVSTGTSASIIYAKASGAVGAVVVETNDTYVDPTSASDEVKKTMAIYDPTQSGNCAENSTYSLPSGD